MKGHLCRSQDTENCVTPEFDLGCGLFEKIKPKQVSLLLYHRSFLGFDFLALCGPSYGFMLQIPVVFDCLQTILKQVIEKSEEVLVLIGLVVECMAYTTFSFYFPLHSHLLWSVYGRSN